MGLRDYAIFLLIATYGLRAIEIVSLKVDDIQWRLGRIRIPRHKSNTPLVLPLMDDLGESLVAYLRRGRPELRYPELFLRCRALAGVLKPTAVAEAFQRWTRRSGLDIPFQGSHCLRQFFADHLPRLRGMSPCTIRSYRDSFKLLLRFVSSQRRWDAAKLDLDDIGPQEVMDFLQHLEDHRHNSAATRNVRLAAIHSFFRYIATSYPERLEHCQRILSIPFKRTRSRTVDYLEYGEIEAVLAAIDRPTFDGHRDYALLVTMFNTGARVQEILDLRPLRPPTRESIPRTAHGQGS